MKENENNIKAVNLVFYNKKREPIEKFIFDFIKLQANNTEYVSLKEFNNNNNNKLLANLNFILEKIHII